MSRLCALACCAVALFPCVAASAGHGVASIVLEDFEREDADDDWSARQVDINLFGRETTMSGSSQAARLVYPQWAPFRRKWPAVILEHGDGQFRTSDWSPYSVLRFEARAHHPRVVHL